MPATMEADVEQGGIDAPADELGKAGRRRFRRFALLGAGLALIPYLYVLSDLFSGVPYLTRAVGPSGVYTYQAYAMLHGHLWIRPADLGIEAFIHAGRAYTYFGIFPSLLRLPFVAVFKLHGNANYTELSMLASWVVTGVFTSLLIWRIRLLVRGRAFLGRVEALAYGILVFLVLAGSVVLFLAAMPWVYNEDFAWAIALSVAVYWSLLGVIDRPTWGRVSITGLLILATSLNRLTAGWACIIGALSVAAWFWFSPKQREKRRFAIPVAIAAAIPLIVSSWINYAKFGLPFGLPMADQVWAHVNLHRKEFLAANGGKAFSFSFLPSTLNAYLNPLNLSISGVFPFFQLPTTLPKIIGSATFDQTYPTSSIPATMPVLFVLGVGGLVAALRRRTVGRLAEARFLLIPAVIGCAGVLLWGYIANRYMADFMPLVIVTSAIGLVVACRWLEPRSIRLRRWLVVGFGLLAGLSMLVNVGVAFTPNSAWSQGQLANFVGAQRTLSITPLSSTVAVVDRLPSYAPAGRLFAARGCDGLYRSNGESFADVPGQQLEHQTMSPVERSSRLVQRFYIKPNAFVSQMRGDTVLFRTGRTKIVARPVFGGLGFFLINESHPEISFPNIGGGFFAVQPGKKYAMEVIHDPNLKSIQLWWFNKRFKDLGIPVIDHVQEGDEVGRIAYTTTVSPIPEITVMEAPKAVQTTRLCRDLTRGR